MRLRRGWSVVALVTWMMVMPLAAADTTLPHDLNEGEETYELRLERLMNAKGKRALVDYLARELQERPRPYVKAWYANFLLYGDDLGVKGVSDPARGFALAEESRLEGSLFGLELVGRAWGDARGTLEDGFKGAKFLREAAERGRNSAMSELAKYCYFGIGMRQDRAAAEMWARRSAWRGATIGMDLLASWVENPKYTVPPDPKKALALYYEVGDLGSLSARTLIRDRAKKGDREAEKYVHLDFVVQAGQGSNPLPTKLRESVKWLRANTTSDDLLVQLALARVMMERKMVVYDAEQAKVMLARAAAAGSDDARALQATMAWRGIGQKTDEAGAIAVWRELAEKNNAEALNRIGWLHWWGNGQQHGIEKDARRAFEFCERAAHLGLEAGQVNVAECHAHGIGTPVNYFLAARYYGILEDRRYPHARVMKERILGYVKD